MWYRDTQKLFSGIAIWSFLHTVSHRGSEDWGSKIKLGFSERSRWDEKDADDCIKKYYSWPNLLLFENWGLFVITVCKKLQIRDPHPLKCFGRFKFYLAESLFVEYSKATVGCDEHCAKHFKLSKKK